MRMALNAMSRVGRGSVRALLLKTENERIRISTETSLFVQRMLYVVNFGQVPSGNGNNLSHYDAAEASMSPTELEQWVCTENVVLYQKRLNDPTDMTPRNQVEGLLARELAKLQAIFPDETFLLPISRPPSQDQESPTGG